MTVYDTSDEETSCFVALDETPRTENGSRIQDAFLPRIPCPISLARAPSSPSHVTRSKAVYTGFDEER